LATITIVIGPVTSVVTTTNIKAQQLVTLALPAWGYPPRPPDKEDGTPGDPLPDTPQAQLDWALQELVSYLVETARREHRKSLEAAEQDAINEAVSGLNL
jgi:hypothetical protein